MPLEVKAQSVESAPAKGLQGITLGRKRAKLSSSDRMFFTEQLALLLETGTSLHAAVKLMRHQMDNPAMQDILDAIANDISEGRTFSYSLSKHPQIFSTTYVSLIAASENGGFMHEVLVQLLEMEEKREQLKSTLSSALSYPGFLVFFSVAVVIFVLVVVFPKFTEMFAKIEGRLPITTKFLMTASDVLIYQWYWICAILTGIVVTLMYWMRTDAGRTWFDQFKLKTPGIKAIFIQLYLLQIMRVMSLSLANGVNVIESLQACKDVVNNRIFQKFLNTEKKFTAKTKKNKVLHFGIFQHQMI